MVLNITLNAPDSHTKYIPPKQTKHAPSRHHPYHGTTAEIIGVLLGVLQQKSEIFRLSENLGCRSEIFKT